ncbi:Flp pilus assembly protein [Vibrio maritimus]|uniref:Flp pilus assembly protein n=1 Tax=Vibrio maritimus TaxID=990268 RepID=A0A090S0I5_9VIBR|nr:Flp pilus assembly protein [Vibrio maritimus]
MMAKLQTKAVAFLNDFKNDERGVTAIEYGLIAAAMAAALTVVFGSDGSIVEPLQNAFNKIVSSL